jgi:hypothetical protein
MFSLILSTHTPKQNVQNGICIKWECPHGDNAINTYFSENLKKNVTFKGLSRSM